MIRLALLALLFPLISFAEGNTKIRVGWQIPWAVQGQLVQVLKHTDILAKNGLEAEFIGKTFGPQLNEIALAGAVDVILTADQPAAALFSKDKGWKGIGRMMYNRTSTYVPPKSSIRSMKDLKGKTVGIPMGAAAERITVAALKKAGLDPQKDVKLVNIDIKEQGPLVSGGGKDAAKWGDFDALAGFDPIPAIFESKGLVKTLNVGKVVSMAVMSEEFMAKNPDVATKFMAALGDAWDHYRSNVKQADAWFMEEAKLDNADDKALAIAASLEPNFKAKNRKAIRVSFNDDDFQVMQQGADFMEPKVGKKVDMKKYVSNEFVTQKK